MEQDDDSDFEGNKLPEFVDKVSSEAKLKELLRNLSSTEIRLSSYASKEFIRLLKGDSGRLLLREYVLSSSNCSELLQAWNLGQGRPGSNYFLSLVSTFLAHPDGMYKANDPDSKRIVISRALDKLARSITDQNLGDICKELSSKEAKHQKAALLLLASIVRRGSSLASDVAKSFDFKLPGFIKLSEYKQKKPAMKKKHSTRRSFVGFAMSFLEVGNPRLLRWVLQQREMYSAVLRGLGDDDDETVVYILSILRDRILVPQSLIPPGLRSVLFGSVTLDNLINISSRFDGAAAAADLSHCVLVAVCTDPSNGLMPDVTRHPYPLRGNPKRLLDLMKKLKATEIEHHRNLLLAIAKGRPSLACLYMDEYPYNLEDHSSPSWFAAVSLAADLISSVGCVSPFSFIELCNHPPSFDSSDVQCVMNCICPRPFTRLVMNKGLLHINSLVKHGTLKVVLEALKLLDSFISIMERKFDSDGQMKQSCMSLKKDIQNEARTLLPDPQVLLSLLSSLSSHYKSLGSFLKRKRGSNVVLEEGNNATKKLKIDDVNEDVDILVGGVDHLPQIALPGDDAVVQDIKNTDLNNRDCRMKVIAEIWGFHQFSMPVVAAEDEETHFYSKLLDTLRFYYRTVPSALEGSFDFFKAIPHDPLSLPVILQQSLLSLLVEVIGWSANSEVPSRIPAVLYKHLQTFIGMLLYSQNKGIKDQAYILAKAAILSTGAFTKNLREIDIWFLFLPSYSMDRFLVGDGGIEVLLELFSVVVTFLCDAVSTVGNNPFKYWDVVRYYMNLLNGLEDVSPEFSPLVVCVLEKCLRVLHSESGSFNLSEKTIISLYVCNTIKYILQTQVEAGVITFLIDRLLSEKVEEHCSSLDSAQDMCEWRPLMNLLLFSRGIENQKKCKDSLPQSYDISFVNVVSEVEGVLRSGTDCGLVQVTKAFMLSLISTPPAVVLQQFPAVLCISRRLFGVPFSILLLIFSLEPNFMDEISKLWPDMFDTGMQWAVDGCHEEEINVSTYSGSPKSASVAFCLFIKQSPYQVLTPMILSISISKLLEGHMLTSMLLDKLSDLSAEYTISLLRLLLFWGHRIRLSYPSKPLNLCESHFRVCSTLIDKTSEVLLYPTDSGRKPTSVTLFSQYMVEAAEIIYSHPLLLSSLESSLKNDREFPKEISEMTLEGFLLPTAKEMQYMDYVVVKFLPAFPENALHFLFLHNSLTEVGDSLERYKKSFRALAKKVFTTFRDRFSNFTQTGDLKPLVPALHALHKLINISFPLEIFELVEWMFSRISLCDLVVGSPEHSAISLALSITSCAFDTLSGWLQQQTHRRISSHIKLCPLEVTSFDLLLFEKVYFRVVDIAMQFDIESADLCLLKAVNVVKILKVGKDHCITLSLDIAKVILNTPTELISHFIYRTSRTRAKMLSSIIDISPVHLSVFGHLLSEMVSKFVRIDENIIKGTCNNAISEDTFLMLLPAAVSYLNTTFVKHKEEYRCLTDISSFYCTILLRNFSDWSNFVSGDLFKVEGDDPQCLSVGDEVDISYGSLLTNTILMLQNHFTSSDEVPMKSKKRLKLFDFVRSESNYLDRDIKEIDVGVTLSSDSVNRIIAKVHFCRMLLFPKTNQINFEVGPHKEDSSRIGFMKILVGTWDWIANKYSFSSGYFKSADLVRKLEAFLLSNILELTRGMGKHLIDHQPFTGLVEKLARSALLYRFGDPKTLIKLRLILASASNNKLHMSVLQLLLAHSQFGPTIHSARKSHESSQFGVTVKPMASILRSLVFPSANQNALDEEGIQQLEVLKLLRVLFSTVTQQPGFNFSKDVGVNSQELLFLLLSSYGATSGKIDLEIYRLMTVLESDNEVNSGIIAEMDFLWGSVAENIMKEKETPSDEVNDMEAIEERRRSQFREKLPIDPRMCANTVLNFPFYRTVVEETLRDDISENLIETPYPNAERLYDPVYILRFSIHCLSTAYIEPMEFASLGLLAVAFISISSPDVELRKLGYEALGRFKTALEECQKRKDRMRLRLLLMYIQNGIEESWQRIPAIIALFAAEASWVLLDPLHDHYSTISKLLMNSPRVNMKSIPLFQSLIWSSSITFKSDRLWILRLLYAGLNSDDDCQLYIRSNVIETLLGCYPSIISDNEATELILQVVKKSLKFRGMARYLVENCGLIPWLSSVVSIFSGIKFQDQRNLSMTMLVTVLELVNDVVAYVNTLEWLQKFAFEQFSELSTHLYKLLADRNFFHEQIGIVSTILKILTSTLEISQKRELYQTHFTLSVESMFRIYEAVNESSDTKYNETAELGLKAALMSAPPMAISDMGEEKLRMFLNWATSTAVQLDSAKARLHRESDSSLLIYLEQEHSEEDSFVLKLLHWLTASVILQRHFNFSSGDKLPLDRSEPKTLLLLLEHAKEQCEGLPVLGNGCEETLATNIFHLQLLLGTNYRLLPSVISAMCLLQFPDLSHVADMRILPDNQKGLSSLCARIRCPAVKVNPAWRWSFNQQWEDISSKYTNSEKVDELQACRSIFLTISSFLGIKKSLSRILSLEDVEKSGVFAWERSLLCGK